MKCPRCKAKLQVWLNWCPQGHFVCDCGYGHHDCEFRGREWLQHTIARLVDWFKEYYRLRC